MVGCSTGAFSKDQEAAECQIWIVDQENKLSFTNCTLAARQNQFLFFFLPVYYKSNEWAGVYGIRERDHEAWSSRQD